MEAGCRVDAVDFHKMLATPPATEAFPNSLCVWQGHVLIHRLFLMLLTPEVLDAVAVYVYADTYFPWLELVQNFS